MNRFSFLCRTKTAAGANALEHLPFDLTAMGAVKPMVIRDKSSLLAGLDTILARAFKDSGMTLGMAPPIPEPSDGPDDAAARFVRSMYTIYREKGFNALIALGSEAAADAAKALNIAVTLGPDALKSPDIAAPLNPLVYIPTGVGTGTATAGEAAFNTRRFFSPFLAPDQVVIAPEMRIPDNRETLVDTALACLAMGCEAHISDTPPARAYASVMAGLVSPVLDAMARSGPDPDGGQHLAGQKKEEATWQADLIQAAVISGYLMSGSPPLLTQVLGREIAARCSTPRGQLMALVLPAVLESAPCADFEGLLFSLSEQDAFSRVPVAQYAPTAVQAIRGMINRFYAASNGRRPRTLAEAGWTQAALGNLGRDLMENDLSGDIDPARVKLVLTHALDGSPAPSDRNPTSRRRHVHA
ncbi:MAG: iron-containing alcohol dehydrogenase [Desulfobacter sp.]